MLTFVITVAIAITGTTLTSFCYSKWKPGQICFNCLFLLLAVLGTFSFVSSHGAFGVAKSLSRNTPFRVLSVTPIDTKSAAVILRNGAGKAFVVKFNSLIRVDTQGVYLLVGNDTDGYNLGPVK